MMETDETPEIAASSSSMRALPIPHISEDDLLNFQFAHFGDDSMPDNWFVDANTAIYACEQQAAEPALGYYPDGVQRTLTDAQIAMFRHSELEELRRAHANGTPLNAPAHDDPSLDPRPVESKKKKKNKRKSKKSTSAAGSLRNRKDEVPYDERNKRKWEQYISREDDVRGALTHRREVREMDNQVEESVEMDYG